MGGRTRRVVALNEDAKDGQEAQEKPEPPEQNPKPSAKPKKETKPEARGKDEEVDETSSEGVDTQEPPKTIDEAFNGQSVDAAEDEGSDGDSDADEPEPKEDKPPRQEAAVPVMTKKLRCETFNLKSIEKKKGDNSFKVSFSTEWLDKGELEHSSNRVGALMKEIRSVLIEELVDKVGEDANQLNLFQGSEEDEDYEEAD